MNALTNNQNLKRLTSEEARKIGAKGGKASAEARKRKNALKNRFEALFEMPVSDVLRQDLFENGVELPEECTFEEALVYSMMIKAISGDAKMVSQILSITGGTEADRQRAERLRLDREVVELKKQLAESEEW